LGWGGSGVTGVTGFSSGFPGVTGVGSSFPQETTAKAKVDKRTKVPIFFISMLYPAKIGKKNGFEHF
jgi:hypothetical protein